MQMLKSNRIFRLICLCLAITMILFLSSCSDSDDSGFYSDSFESEEDPADDDYAALFEDYFDAEAYFLNNSTIISTIDITESENIHNESDTYYNLTDRGFSDTAIIADFDMNGEILEDAVISNTSSDNHPCYTTSYIASTGETWIINEINGIVMAMPSAYNMEQEIPVIITETGTVMSYDLYGNRFYETIPNESEMIVKTVDRVDADTLEKLTAEEIEAL